MDVPNTESPNTESAFQRSNEPTLKKPLRLWPGVVAVVLQWLLWFVVPIFAPPEIALYAKLGAVICALAIVVWWLFFSRAPWIERVGVLVLMVITVIAGKRVVHESIANGMMGRMLYVFVVPFFCLALVAALAVGRRLSTGTRRAVMVGAIVLACGVWTLVRTGGITGNVETDFHWRWTKSPEEKLVAASSNEPLATVPAIPANLKTGTEWPGFRGPDRDGIVHGVRIKTDWTAAPPVELWRRPIGPAWSSFAVSGDVFYTQEQRGEDELVVCYNLTTGKPVWKHRDAARFWESNGGAGPRSTPTLNNGRIYTLGGTGILNALDATTGAVVWSRNAAADTKVKLPGWGFSSSPLVVGDVVIVATAGTLAAYDLATGTPRWFGANGGGSYSSPHLATIQGVQQVIMLNNTGAISVAPADGKRLWEHPLPPGARIVQPGLTAEGDVLAHEGEGAALHRIAATQGAGGWTVTERWTTDGLNPYFSDFVVHKGHAFGFSGSNIVCIDLQNGERKWKGGSYGHGQLVLLADQDVMVVISELGELALVGATPGQFAELARFPAIKGKTWNHPVLAGDVLLVRNGEEMVAFRLARAS